MFTIYYPFLVLLHLSELTEWPINIWWNDKLWKVGMARVPWLVKTSQGIPRTTRSRQPGAVRWQHQSCFTNLVIVGTKRMNFPICPMNMDELSYLDLVEALTWNVQPVSISTWISKEESGKRQFWTSFDGKMLPELMFLIWWDLNGMFIFTTFYNIVFGEFAKSQMWNNWLVVESCRGYWETPTQFRGYLGRQWNIMKLWGAKTRLEHKLPLETVEIGFRKPESNFYCSRAS